MIESSSTRLKAVVPRREESGEVALGRLPEEERGPSTHDVLRRLEDGICTVIRGKREVARQALVSMLAGGHLLIEDVPGVGKTTLARALARSLGLSFQRVQFTSDMMPSDIIGVSVYQQDAQEFRFNPGPLFAHVVLADEINRATPKTQSALLEAMSEGMVSVDRKRYRLPAPFWVVATQNPLEHQGTFPLPESQLDRFLMSIRIGYPERADERELLLAGGVDEALEDLEPVLDAGALLALQTEVRRVHVEPKLADYMLEIADGTRESGQFLLGVSTRGVQSLFAASQARALLEGRDYVLPDDVKAVAVPVLAHRVVVRATGDPEGARRAMGVLLASLPVPI